MRPHRIALGQGEKREVPHRLVPDAGLGACGFGSRKAFSVGSRA
jgi:hypothetical protein